MKALPHFFRLHLVVPVCDTPEQDLGLPLMFLLCFVGKLAQRNTGEYQKRIGN